MRDFVVSCYKFTEFVFTSFKAPTKEPQSSLSFFGFSTFNYIIVPNNSLTKPLLNIFLHTFSIEYMVFSSRGLENFEKIRRRTTAKLRTRTDSQNYRRRNRANNAIREVGMVETIISGQKQEKLAGFKKVESYINSGDYENVRKFLAGLYNKNHNDAYVISMLIKVNGLMGNLKEAEEFFHYALENNLADKFIFYRMMDVYFNARKMEEGKKVFDMALKAGQIDIRSYTCVIMKHLRIRDFEYADNFLEYMVPEEIRNNPEILLVEAEILRKKKLYGKAIMLLNSLLQNVLINETQITLAKTLIAYCKKDSGQVMGAFNDFLELSKSVSETAKAYPRIICGLVFSYEELGRSELLSNDELDRLYCLLKTFRRVFINGTKEIDLANALDILERGIN